MDRNARIFVAGGGKPIGAALLRALRRRGFTNIVGDGEAEPLYTEQADVNAFFAREKPEYVFVAGGKAGGIGFNQKHPAELVYDNLCLATNVISAAYTHGVEKLLFLASSCCYPKECPQPMREEYLLTGPLEPTNEPYAVAKLAGISLCRSYRKQHGCDFVAAVPSNYFGPGDDFSPENSHVIGALIRRMHDAALQGAEEVEIWGTGKPRREFIYIDDLAEACLVAMDKYSSGVPINLGSDGDVSIAELATMIQKIVGFQGRLRFDPGKPDGMMVKILESSAINGLGWAPAFTFSEAIQQTYEWYLSEWCGQEDRLRKIRLHEKEL